MLSKLWINRVDLMVKLNLQSTLGVLWAGLSSDGSSKRRLLLRVPKAVYGHFRTVVGPRVPHPVTGWFINASFSLISFIAIRRLYFLALRFLTVPDRL